jgi:anti-sigma factor (TIGR02949 family)
MTGETMSFFDKLKALFGGGRSEGGPPDPESTSGGGDGMAGEGMAGAAGMISCEDALRLVHEFLDGELEDASATEVKQHFDMCQQCYPHLHLETAFREAVRRAFAGESAPPDLKAKVSALLAEEMSAE